MVEFVLGTAGSGKSCRIAEKAKKLYAEGCKVLVIVPDQFTFDYSNFLYQKLGAECFNAIEINSFERIAADITSKHSAQSSIAPPLARQIIMFRAISRLNRERALVYYQKQAAYPQFANNCLDVVKELRISNISCEMLTERALQLDENIADKIGDLSRIYTEYERLLAENNLNDGLGVLSDAADFAEESAYFSDYRILIDEFKSFTADEIQLLRVMICDAEEVTLTLTTDNESVSPLSVFYVTSMTLLKIKEICSEVNSKWTARVLTENLRFKNEGLGRLGRRLFEYESDSEVITTGEAVKVTEAGDCYSESEYVCAEIRRLVKEDGYSFRDIAVISRNLGDYAQILESEIRKYGIPCYFDVETPARHSAVLLYASALLALAVSGTFRTQLILTILKTGLTPFTEEQTGNLENYCYKWNIDGEIWNSEFQFCEKGEDELQKYIVEAVKRFREDASEATGDACTRAFYRLLVEMGAPQRINEAAANAEIDNAEALELSRDMLNLWGELIKILDELYKYTTDYAITLTEFRDIFTLAVSSATDTRPPNSLDSVAVSSAQRSRLSAPRVTFVMGVNDGFFPAVPPSRGLLSDNDLRKMRRIGIEIFDDTMYCTAEERFIAYSAVTSPSERLYLCFCRADSSGSQRHPSSIIRKCLDITDIGGAVQAGELGTEFYCSAPRAAYSYYIRNLRSGEIKRTGLCRALSEIPEYAQRLSKLREVSEGAHRLTDRTLIPQLLGGRLRLSPSRFEEYQKCPFTFFCRKCLNIMQDDRVEINPARSGSATHYCLEKMLSRRSKEEFVGLSKEEMSREIGELLEEFLRDEMGGDFAKSARFLYNYDRLRATVLRVAANIREEFSQSDFTPSDFELRIGGRDAIPMKIDCGDGFDILITGFVDRVDSCEIAGRQYVRVIDYKSGGKEFRTSDILYGLNMQMLIYLFALTQEGGKYAGYQPAGVLYLPAVDVQPDGGRSQGEDYAEEKLAKSFAMRGLLLDDELCIEAMEKGAAGRYIPVVRKADGSFSKKSKLTSGEELEKIREWSVKIITAMGNNLRSGVVAASPLFHGRTGPCSYCEYGEVCGGSNAKRYTSAEREKKFLAELFG